MLLFIHSATLQGRVFFFLIVLVVSNTTGQQALKKSSIFSLTISKGVLVVCMVVYVFIKSGLKIEVFKIKEKMDRIDEKRTYNKVQKNKGKRKK